MHWPKRFRLHEAAASKADETPYQTEVIQGHGSALYAVDGVGVARLPVLGPDERPGAELPRLERGEAPPVGVLPPKAIQEAAQGSSGAGRLVILGPHAVEAQRDAGKPWMRFDRPAQAELPPVQEVFERVVQEPPAGAHWAEVCLDAEALVRLSRAIGAGEGVRLRFLVDQEGRCSAEHGAHGFIDVRDADRPDDGPRAVLAAVVKGRRS